MLKKKYALVCTALCAVFLLMGSLAATAQTAIIDKGVAKATIYLDASAPASVQLAASDLQKHLKLVSGVELPITSDVSKLSGYVIYLGDTKFALQQGIKVQQLPSDGFRILANKDWMVIAGKDYAGEPQTGFNNPYRINESYNTKYRISAFGNAGTLFGVYHFLERYCGIRWYMPGPLGIVAPKANKIVVPAINLRKAPAFEHRYGYYGFLERSDDDALWYRRAGFGTPAPIQISHSFGQFFLKYKDTHPEYFAIIDGQHDFTNLSTAGGGNLNLSNPGLIRQAIDDAILYFDQNPQQKIYPLCPNDGMRRISDDHESQAQIDKSRGEAGEFSNYIWGFINKVATGVAKKYPDKLIGCISYEHYSLPPSNIKRMSPNVAVVICKFRAMYPDKTSEKETQERVIGWKKMTDHVYSWEYYCNSLFNPNWRGYPMFFSKLLQEDLKFLKGKIKGEFIEGESWTPEQYSTAPEKIKINYPGLQHPLLYVTARLLWDPDLNVNALLDEYYRLFYGPAEKPMRQFWGLVESNWMKKGWSSSPSNVYDVATVVKLLDLLKDAQKKAAAASVYRQRVNLIFSEFSPAAEVNQRLEKLSKPILQVPPLAADVQANGNSVMTTASGSMLQQFLDRNYNISSPVTNMLMAWDAQNLYVNMQCYEPDMGKIKTNATSRDSLEPPIWEDDAIEFFLMPDAAMPEKGLHYIVTARGAIFDARIVGTSKAEDSAWNSKAKVNVVKETSRWVVRLAIPWSELEVVNPVPGRKIKANFYRSRYATGQLEQSSWAPLMDGRFYTPQYFGELVLAGAEPVTAVQGDPSMIVPASVKDYGSGASLQGFYGEGGIGGVGLFVGQPNTLTRNDRAVFKFDLKPLLELTGKIQKVELSFAVATVAGEVTDRTLNLQHFQLPLASVGPEATSRNDVDDVANVAVTPASVSGTRSLGVDVTKWVKSDLAKGQTSSAFRFRDIQAEKEGNLKGIPSGAAIAGAANNIPALVITMEPVK